MQTCATDECEGVVFQRHRCLGHLAEDHFDEALHQLRVYGDDDVDASGATITGERLTLLVSELAGSARRFDFTSARVSGDVLVDNVSLHKVMSFSGAQLDGTLAVRGTTGLQHLVLDGLQDRRTTLGGLELTGCVGEDWTVQALDVGSLTIHALETSLLELEDIRLGNNALIRECSLARGLRVRDAAWDHLSIRDVTTAGVVSIAANAMNSLTLAGCELASASFRVCAPLVITGCRIEGSLDVGWHRGWASPPDDARVAHLMIHSTHVGSNAHLAWGGDQISLTAVVFSAASRLERDPAALGIPTLAHVERLDGEKLRIGEINLRQCNLSEAASLGAIQSIQLPLGLGSAGLTWRRYVADEGQRRSETREERRARAPMLARTYRDLRTSCEAVGDHASANDLHYGERLWERKASSILSVQWLWLWLYGLFGYGVRPWRPLAALVICVLASAAAFGLLDGLDRQRTVDGTADERIADLCDRGAPATPDRRQVVLCPASAEERLEFSLRATTALIRPIGGYEVRGAAAVIDIALRLLAALFFGLFVLAIRNRVRR